MSDSINSKRKFNNKPITILSLLFLVLVCVASCQRYKVKVSVTKMIGKELIFPDSMLCFDSGFFSDSTISINEPSIIFWLDSSDCTKCNVDRLYEYHSMIEDFEDSLFVDIAFYPIVSIGSQNQNNNNLLNLNFPIFLDRTNSFKRLNSFIPDDKRYHFFLLDNVNVIKLVGDPRYSVSLNNLYFKTIKLIDER